MNIEDRILFLENGSPCIFFPVGTIKDGGTCQYMTKECFDNCPSTGVVYKHETRAYIYFCNTSADDIVERIIKELTYFKSNFLGWFSWGDCPDFLIDKVCDVMITLNKMDIIQNGFTRNRKLWDKMPSLPNLRISLSVDSEKEAIHDSQKKTICFPDIDRGQARVFSNGKMIARCSGYFCYHVAENRTVESDCVACYKNKGGCFN